jgi:bifunctional UDP-N-acetylglucosamine pyrophosphorylase/glucosamine-1-phosphate N-acetyltransferase
MRDVAGLILAGGRGTRMHSEQSKVLHRVADRAILDWLLDACQLAGMEQVVVVINPAAEDIRQHIMRDNHELDVHIAVQNEPRGTGDAVRAALDKLGTLGARYVMILLGDLPNIQAATLKKMMAKRDLQSMRCLTVVRDDPSAYGRIIRNEENKVVRIVEFKDCTPEEALIHEVNVGLYCVPLEYLNRVIPRLTNNNAAGEYYLTDIVELAAQDGINVNPIVATDQGEVMGVNTRDELELVEAWRRKRNI